MMRSFGTWKRLPTYMYLPGYMTAVFSDVISPYDLIGNRSGFGSGFWSAELRTCSKIRPDGQPEWYRRTWPRSRSPTPVKRVKGSLLLARIWEPVDDKHAGKSVRLSTPVKTERANSNKAKSMRSQSVWSCSPFYFVIRESR